MQERQILQATLIGSRSCVKKGNTKSEHQVERNPLTIHSDFFLNGEGKTSTSSQKKEQYFCFVATNKSQFFDQMITIHSFFKKKQSFNRNLF